MTPLLIGISAVAAFILLLLLNAPVAVCTGVVGFVGLWLTGGLEVAENVIFTGVFGSTATYTLTVLPLFMLMGYFAETGGYVHDFFEVARKWFGSVRGALSLATMLTSGALGAITGSAGGATALMAKVTVPEMRKAGYDPGFAAGTVAMGGTLAGLIPPSLGMVFLAVLSDVSVGKALMAGLVPGLMTMVGWILMIALLAFIRPQYFPAGVRSYPLRDKIAVLKGTWSMVILIILVFGGLYTGIFTATESAAVGAIGALLLLFVKKKGVGKISKVLSGALLDVARTTGAILIIIGCIAVFTVFLARSGCTGYLTNLFASLPLSPYILIVAFMVLYLVLGLFMDAFGMYAITMPILLPVVVQLGFDPIWWCVIVVKMAEIGSATPPFAMGVFVVKSVVPDIEIQSIYKGCIPFLLMEIPFLALLVAFPQIALFIPQGMGR